MERPIIQKISVKDQVFDELKKMILDGKWNIGEKLPSENDLAEIFGVNRLTVRGAIQKLNTIGITETKAGQGTFVKGFDLESYMDQVSDIILNQEEIDNVLEVRKILELASLKLAVERATKEDFESLNSIINIYEKLGKEIISSDYINQELFENYADSDFNIHLHIVKMAHNPVLQSAYAIVKETIHQYIRFILSKRINEKNYSLVVDNDPHRKIYNELKAGNLDKATRAYEEMMDYNLDNEKLLNYE